jgi:predicted transcriptional regulator
MVTAIAPVSILRFQFVIVVSSHLIRRLRRVAGDRKHGKESSRNFKVDNDEDFRHYRLVPSHPPRPTDAELAILRVLWESGPLPVREIQRILDREKPTGYTTALKMLQIMTEKGLVDRDESVRPQIYRARYSRRHTQRRLVDDLLTRAFGGSVRELVLQALSTKRSTPAELAEIEKLLDRIEGESK